MVAVSLCDSGSFSDQQGHPGQESCDLAKIPAFVVWAGEEGLDTLLASGQLKWANVCGVSKA